MVPQRYLVLLEIVAYLALHKGLRRSHFLQALLDLLLQRRLKVKLVNTVQGNHRVEQVVRVEALGADLLLALQTEQNVVLGVLGTLLVVADGHPLVRHRVFQQATLRTICLSYRRVKL